MQSTAIRARTEGCRNVAGETSVPSRILEVTAASAETVAHASSEPPVAAVEVRVVIGSEQALEAGVLAGPGKRDPLLPGDALLALDHQADPHRPNPTGHKLPSAAAPAPR